MSYIQDARKLKEYLAYLIGPYSSELSDSKKDQKITDITNALNKMKTSLNAELIEADVENLNLVNEISELETLKNLTPEDSLTTIMGINKRVTELSKKLQNEITFDPQMYYNMYFLTVGSTVNPDVKIETEKLGTFKNWFADSQVVNEEGEPLEVYHGTGNDLFTKFTFDVFPGAYFAEKKSYSEWFQKAKGSKGSLFKCYLRILNSLDLTIFETDKVKYKEFTGYLKLRYGYELPENKRIKAASEKLKGLWAWQYLRMSPDWIKYIKNQNLFDGIKFFENNPQDIVKGKENVTLAYMVFEPSQIKEVTGNLLFSMDSEDIRFDKGGEI